MHALCCLHIVKFTSCLIAAKGQIDAYAVSVLCICLTILPGPWGNGKGNDEVGVWLFYGFWIAAQKHLSASLGGSWLA